MPTVNDLAVDGLLWPPLVLPVLVAGALMALLIILTLVILPRTGDVRRLFLSIVGLVVGVMVFAALVYQLATNNVAMERRSLLARNMALTERALAPGSALTCLDYIVGEATENDCQKAVFADPQSTARAVAYTAARLTLLREAVDFAHNTGDTDLLESFSSTRRMIALDRYGFAAQVLSIRDGCTLERCYAFALVEDAGVLKTNLKNQVFEQYVSRYSAIWHKINGSEQQPVAPGPSTVPTEPLASGELPKPPGHPVDGRWDFPSSASIPPVNIITNEPPSLKAAETEQADSPNGTQTTTIPVPVKRPSTKATGTPTVPVAPTAQATSPAR